MASLRSPYNFLQEDYSESVWHILVVCILLNQTSYKQVKPILNSFFTKYSNPADILNCSDIELCTELKSLGFQNRRCKQLKNMSEDFLNKNWNDVIELRGIGKYASDAYKIFYLDQYLTTDPNDKELLKYQEWRMTI